MADTFSRERRSEIMSRIKGRNNQATELKLIKVFRANRIKGWRRGQPIFGKPDFVFPEARIAIFVDGCFWHSCPLHGEIPATNKAFWKTKLTRNQKRDLVVNSTLKKEGWKVVRVCQHDLATPKNIAKKIARLVIDA